MTCASNTPRDADYRRTASPVSGHAAARSMPCSAGRWTSPHRGAEREVHWQMSLRALRTEGRTYDRSNWTSAANRQSVPADRRRTGARFAYRYEGGSTAPAGSAFVPFRLIDLSDGRWDVRTVGHAPLWAVDAEQHAEGPIGNG